ncbi:hypothetical protein BC832DRAFT_539640 [Gaertneriomyces semiglobifer]|nr:hypothetical protein BC832DRAFT_539640 [Gaertneriomyces semiglobifer]
MPAFRLYDAADVFLAQLPYVSLPSHDIMNFCLKTGFPRFPCSTTKGNGFRTILTTSALATANFGYTSQVTPMPSFPTWRFRGSSPAGSRKSARTSEGQSPAGAMSQPISAAEVEERLVRKQQKDLQKAHRSVMRQACLRRDQFCVLTGECEDTAVKCCHVLTPEYAAKWFAEDTERMEFLCGLPIGAGRYLPGFDTRNGLIMQAALHEMYDAFLFSIWPNEDDNKYYVHLFRPVTGLVDGHEVTTPRMVPRGENPNYLIDLFPHPTVLRAHFQQAVLYNMRGGGEPYEPEEDTDSEDDFAMDQCLRINDWDTPGELALIIARRAELRRSYETLYDEQV